MAAFLSGSRLKDLILGNLVFKTFEKKPNPPPISK